MEDHAQEFEAKTVDEAIILAMKTLHADFEDLDITVVSEGSKGLFGIVGSKNAKILARKKGPGSRPGTDRVVPPPEAPAPRQPVDTGRPGSPDTQAAPAQDVLEQAKEVVSRILGLIGLRAEVRPRDDGMLEIVGDGSGIIIGKHGQTLDALQFIVNRIVNKSRQDQVHVTIDTEGYRKRHIDHLKALAIKMGQKAKKTGHPVTLEKMNPYERRIIHLALKDERFLDTKSIGEGVYKRVMIVPKRASRR
ncbi:MAG TPA: RNA-binding cell elongation regulator Jag/EloR [Deltaproteobacteria bacterium]|nr:RNA-binding cell elongation regulator Jag/EloR [Deltaproteobacteria bacterium]HOM29099.1 RNA-binding cell elongation regulator Jag/EloR [Deltaproteobacteria bacterium]HPP80042.1 RNA-binding cell elongation regulator Jag/EloR [Deltaproteobacteria bacterium]